MSREHKIIWTITEAEQRAEFGDDGWVCLKFERDGARFEVTTGGVIKIEIGGSVHVRSAREWHALAAASFRSAVADTKPAAWRRMCLSGKWQFENHDFNPILDAGDLWEPLYLASTTSHVPTISAAEAVERCAAIVDEMQEAWHDSDEENSGHYMDAADRIASVLRERAKHPPFSSSSASGDSWISVKTRLPDADEICLCVARDRQYVDGFTAEASPWSAPEVKIARGWWIREWSDTEEGARLRKAEDRSFGAEAMLWMPAPSVPTALRSARADITEDERIADGEGKDLDYDAGKLP